MLVTERKEREEREWGRVVDTQSSWTVPASGLVTAREHVVYHGILLPFVAIVMCRVDNCPQEGNPLIVQSEHFIKPAAMRQWCKSLGVSVQGPRQCCETVLHACVEMDGVVLRGKLLRRAVTRRRRERQRSRERPLRLCLSNGLDLSDLRMSTNLEKWCTEWTQEALSLKLPSGGGFWGRSLLFCYLGGGS